MATLTKTSKLRGYLDGKPGGRSIFKEFETFGINIRAVRRYQNTDREGLFHTVEIKKNRLQEILEDKLDLRQENNILKEKLEIAENRICYLEQQSKVG
jgi:hypothetical protein